MYILLSFTIYIIIYTYIIYIISWNILQSAMPTLARSFPCGLWWLTMTWSPRGHAKPQPTSSSPAAINMVPAPIATLRNLNIVQNGSILAILFSFWASGIAMFRSLFFEKKARTQLSHKRYLIWNEVNIKWRSIIYVTWTELQVA